MLLIVGAKRGPTPGAAFNGKAIRTALLFGEFVVDVFNGVGVVRESAALDGASGVDGAEGVTVLSNFQKRTTPEDLTAGSTIQAFGLAIGFPGLDVTGAKIGIPGIAELEAQVSGSSMDLMEIPDHHQPEQRADKSYKRQDIKATEPERNRPRLGLSAALAHDQARMMPGQLSTRIC